MVYNKKLLTSKEHRFSKNNAATNSVALAGTADAATSTNSTNSNSTIWKDERFSHLVKDPRFKNIHQSTKKVKIDKRFESMFHDKKFKVKYTVDKYGRKVNQSSSENLRKYYDLSSDDGEESNEDEERAKEEAELQKEANMQTNSLLKDDEPAETNYIEKDESDDEGIALNVRNKLKNLDIDYARGEGKLLTDSSSDEETSEDDDSSNELYIEHVWGDIDKDSPTTDESTHRLAACNMDWDRMRASDIMVLCSSFLPPGGSIISVTIYPSEYGKQRLAEENVKGPQELIETKIDDDDEDDDELIEYKNDYDTGEGSSYQMEKLRQYQLNRLKYYYAVIICDSISTADKLYKECDGLEYESTATKVSLSYIPDDMTFDDEPKDACTELPDLAKYMPRNFTTTALQQAKVELTWDETNLERKELNDKLIAGKLNDVPDAELRKYVAYSSEENDSDIDNREIEEEEGKQQQKITKDNTLNCDENLDKFGNDLTKIKTKNSLSKYKDLLMDINKKEEEKKNKIIEMEYTWGIGIKDKTDKLLENKQLVKTPELAPFEKILEKRKQKKKALKEERKQLRKNQNKDNDDDADSDISLDEDLPVGIDLNDPYFAEEFANGNFEKPKKKKINKITKNDKDNGITSEEQQASELALLLDEDDGADDGKSHFSLKKIQDIENITKTKKRKHKLLKKKNNNMGAIHKTEDNIDDFKINVTDNRFSAVYSSHLFNIDPSDPHYKKTKGMENIIMEKLKRKQDSTITGSTTDNNDNQNKNEDCGASNSKIPKKDVAVNMLVKNIKRKLQT